LFTRALVLKSAASVYRIPKQTPKQELIQTELESKPKEPAALHAELASAQAAELASVPMSI
jgi:hypothetical protein